MSLGGSGGGTQFIPVAQTSSTNTSTNIPQWLTDASVYGVNNARKLLSQPTQGYQGPLSPGMTADQTAAGDMIRNSFGTTAPDYGAARDAYGRSMESLNPATLAGGLSGIGQYMNPYISNVVDSVNAISRQNLGDALNQTRDSAIRSSAYGGSRQGVREGVAIAQNNQNTNNVIANLLNSGYTQAQQGVSQDAAIQNAAAQQNRANALAGGQAVQGLGTAARAASVADINNLYSYGANEQQTQAAQQQAAYNEWMRVQNMPQQLQQLYNQTVQAAPHSTSGSSNTTSLSMQPQQQPSSNLLQTGLGLAGMAAGAYLGGPAGAAAGSRLTSSIGGALSGEGAMTPLWGGKYFG